MGIKSFMRFRQGVWKPSKQIVLNGTENLFSVSPFRVEWKIENRENLKEIFKTQRIYDSRGNLEVVFKWESLL